MAVTSRGSSRQATEVHVRMKLCALVSLCALLLAAPAFAQEQTGSIQGTVKDSSGGVLPGVTVEARSPSVIGVSTTVTDTMGNYRFPALPPGTYIISATLSGFTPAKVENSVVVLGQLLTINLSLNPAKVNETVLVTAHSPIIDVKQNATFSTVGQDLMDRIPKGRDFSSVIAMSPGSNLESRAGGVSIGGASGSENRFIVDGIDTTNLQTGASGKAVVTDFVQEVQVKTSGYNAEFPGATGGVINAITKSGSNVFRVDVGTYYTNNESLKGAVRPTVRPVPTNASLAELVKFPLDEIPDWQPVLEASGPVVRNKAWFYVGYAPVRTHTTRTVTFRTPPTNGGPATQSFTQ